MAAKKWKIAAVWVMPEVTFGTDPDSDGSDYKHIKVLPDAAFQPMADFIEREGLAYSLTKQDAVIGAKGGTLTFKVEMKGSGTAAGSATVATAAEASALLESVLGTVSRGTGDATTTGSTSSVLNVSDGTRFSKYMAVCVLGEVRIITSISVNALTLDRALSLGAPADGSVVYASSKFTRANTAHKSLAFVVKRDGIEYTLLGCKITAKLSGFTAKGTCLLDCSVEASDWNVTTKASLPATALTGITAVKAPVIKGSPLAVAGTEEPIVTAEFDPGSVFNFQQSTSGLQGRAGLELVDSNPQGSFQPYYSSSRLPTHFLGGATRTVMFSAGDQTNGFAVYIPKAQYNVPALTDADGMVTEQVPFMVRDNGTDPEYVICQF